MPTPRTFNLAAAPLLCLALTLACSPDAAANPDADGVYRSDHESFTKTVVVEGLDNPWSMAILPDGRWLICEKKGTLRVVQNGKLLDRPVRGTPEVHPAGQGGLLEVALHPDYAQPGNRWVYLAYSHPIEDANGRTVAMTRVVRGRITSDNRWTDEEPIFEAPPSSYLRGRNHYGTRIVFHDGYLFLPIGDRGVMRHAQDLSLPNGKVHRVFDDGRIPDDNPFVNHPDHPDALPTIWTYGNRNPQGLNLRPGTDELWSVEHGPRGGDELNLIRPGINYGWPEITYGINYNGTPISDKTEAPGMEQPVVYWTPSLAVCGMDFYTGDRFPNWAGDLFIAALIKQEVRRVRLHPTEPRVIEQEVIIKDEGRVRDIHVTEDGQLYVVFHRPGQIARLDPTNRP
ncbi:MAG: PQQ-dependent sugar dehydrogenase [Planctomycetota bacterium]